MEKIMSSLIPGDSERYVHARPEEYPTPQETNDRSRPKISVWEKRRRGAVTTLAGTFALLTGIISGARRVDAQGPVTVPGNEPGQPAQGSDQGTEAKAQPENNDLIIVEPPVEDDPPQAEIAKPLEVAEGGERVRYLVFWFVIPPDEMGAAMQQAHELEQGNDPFPPGHPFLEDKIVDGAAVKVHQQPLASSEFTPGVEQLSIDFGGYEKTHAEFWAAAKAIGEQNLAKLADGASGGMVQGEGTIAMIHYKEGQPIEIYVDQNKMNGYIIAETGA